jgi:hypothetical protein
VAFTYCYMCSACGEVVTSPSRDAHIYHEHSGLQVELTRSYQAERAGFTGLAEMKKQREQGLDGLSGRMAQRDLFLPTAEEMRSPTDPTGQKGIREWNEKHEPRPSNKAPLRPEYEKTQF